MGVNTILAVTRFVYKFLFWRIKEAQRLNSANFYKFGNMYSMSKNCLSDLFAESSDSFWFRPRPAPHELGMHLGKVDV